MSLSEQRPEIRKKLVYFDQFSAEVIERFMEATDQMFFFSKRGPFYIAQDIMISLGFWPTDSLEITSERISALEEIASLKTNELSAQFNANYAPNIENGRQIFISSLTELLSLEISQYDNEVPDGLRNLYEKIQSGKLDQVSFWEQALLLKLKTDQGRTITNGVNELLSSTEEVIIEDSIFSQFQPPSPRTVQLFEEPSLLERSANGIERLSKRGLMVVTHGLSEVRLREQMFLKALGSYPMYNYLSFSEERVFIPTPRTFELRKGSSWAMFFDPNSLKQAGIFLYPDIRGHSKPGENEVYVFPPVDLSLCFAAVPIKFLEEECMWNRSSENHQMLEIPEELHDPQKLLEFLGTKI